jgi:chemotaxis signal transduction protein
VSDRSPLLHARAAGRDLLLSVAELQEVVAPAPVTPVPGGPPGIQGVVVHQGEFLPVLAWKDLPGCDGARAEPAALAVFRRRLGVPLDRLVGTLEAPEAGWRPLPEEDAWSAFSGGACEVEGRALPLLDLDRLLALLHRFRTER